MPLSRPKAELNKTELKKSFYPAPDEWLRQQGIADAGELVHPWLLKREQALEEKKAYKEKTGQLSREIGTLKKAGQPADALINEMKSLKTGLKALDECVAKAESEITEVIERLQRKQIVTEKTLSQSEKNTPPLNLAGLVVTPLTNALKQACIDYVQHSTDATLYHHPAWGDLIEKSFGHRMHYSVALIEGEVVGVLPVVTMSSRLFGCFGVSMPYFNYGGPIGDAEGIVDALIKVSEQQAVQSKLQHIEHRGLKPLPQYPGHNNKVSMWLELPETSESLWQALGAKVRAQVNKAKPHGLTAHSGGAELLDDFYRVFAINMRDLGTPVYAKSFFQNVLDTEIGSKQIVLLKNSQGEPVSAAFLMGYKGQLEVPWASTLKKANHTNANMMLYWHMLKYACDECYKVFDFGRSSVDASTFKFKKQWGAKPVQLHWHYWLANGGELPQLNPSNPKYKMVIWLWQKLPVWLTRLIGPLIVKNLP